jgi:hypothetical protein
MAPAGSTHHSCGDFGLTPKGSVTLATEAQGPGAESAVSHDRGVQELGWVWEFLDFLSSPCPGLLGPGNQWTHPPSEPRIPVPFASFRVAGGRGRKESAGS